MRKPFWERFADAFQRMILTGLKPLFVTFILGNLLVLFKFIEKPSFKDWCVGTMFLLVGGGAIKAGKGMQEKFANKM